MRIETLSSPSFTLLLVLEALPRGHSERSLQQIMDRDLSLTRNSLHFLRDDGCVWENPHTKEWRMLPGPCWDQALQLATRFLEKDMQCPLMAHSLLLLRRQDILQGCEKLLAVVSDLMRKGFSAAVITCLDILIAYLRDFSFHSCPAEDVRRYLLLILEVQGISMYMDKRSAQALALLPQARQAAVWLGDRRMLLLVDLVQAEHGHLAQSHNTVQPYALLERTLEALRELGDSDILAQASPALGTLHFMQADYVQALKYMQTPLSASPLRSFDYCVLMLPRTMSSAASSVGKFDLAVGALESALREARLNNHILAAKWWQTHLADMLLRMGRQEAALEHLDAVFPCCDLASETKLWAWNVRTLAYYHYQQNRIHMSHHVLYEGMRLSGSQGLVRPYYAFTWLFDMLHAYAEAGLPPIPGYDLETELAAAMQSPSRQFKGAALRIRAIQQGRLGASALAQCALLQKSLEHARAVGNPLEIARTQLALSQSLAPLGKEEEAQAHRQSARAVLAAHNQYDCPPPAVAPAELYVPSAQHCTERCTQALEDLPSWSELPAHLQAIVDALREALEVERAALFILENGKPRCLASRHISIAELESASFAALHAWMSTCVSQGILDMRQDAQGARLCLPLPMVRLNPCLLYLECVYAPERLSLQEASVFEHVRQRLYLELHTTLRVHQRMQESQRNAEEKARATAVQLAGHANLYYGASMLALLQQADQVAATDAPVLIGGETGVGKEMLAKHLHTRSGRNGPFVPVHPASTPESLFESEFFGHEKGAFTGAHRQKIGLFELADKGTLFIDELGDVPASMQVKLLRVLQEKCFLRVGGIREIRSDFRIICATNRDLKQMVHNGSFREDLYYRLSVVPLRLPALRERPEDILPLACFFLESFARRYRRPLPLPPQTPLPSEEQRKLHSHAWPGNIRELKSLMERATILYNGGPLHFDLGESPPAENALRAASPPLSYDPWQDLPTLDEVQRRYIQHVLALTRGRIDGQEGAAHILGMKRSTLYAKVRQYKLDPVSQLYGAGKVAEAADE